MSGKSWFNEAAFSSALEYPLHHTHGFWLNLYSTAVSIRAMLENPMVSGLAAHQTRIECRDARAQEAFELLWQEFIDALPNPTQDISTPSFKLQVMPLNEVVSELLMDDIDDSFLSRMLQLAHRHADDAEVAALLDELATRHANLHVTRLTSRGAFDD